MTYDEGVTPDESYAFAQDLAALGAFADAIRAYSFTLDSNPDHIQARCGRGLAFQRIGQHSKAIADFDAIITCNPDWPGALLAYYGRAASRKALGQYLQAVEDCNEAINRNPKLTDALYLRGTTQKVLGNIDAAISDMDAVLNADADYHEAYRVRGSLYYLQQRWEQAVDDFTAAIRHGVRGSEGARECFYLRGMAAQELGDHCAAIADFNRAIELLPNDAGPYMRRSRSYSELGKAALADADFRTGTRLTRG